MAAEPSPLDVEGFCSITTSHSHDEAVAWLKAYDNDVNRAINAFFEDPDALRKQASHNTWDESQFHTDRTDNAQQSQNQPSFTVHAQDNLNPNVFADNASAPSRPPTRNSNRMTDLPGELDMGSKRQLTLAEREQAEVERAMAMSIDQGQVTGVTDAADSSFGVATREYYDTKQWAMTYPAANAQEILLNPVPADRKRGPNTPAFLKPSPAEHRLPALVKILHAIPLSREALLNRNYTLPEYGHDPEWWDGVPIRIPKIVDISPEGQYNDRQEIIHEAQRLMAFLEETDRAYGSADVLANMDGIRGSRKSNIIANFLEQWRAATWRVDPNAALLDIFKNEGTRLSHYGDEVTENPVFYTLQISVDGDIADIGLSLYEAFDDILWNGNGDNDFEEVFLQTVGDVFILEVSRQRDGKSGLGIDIPAVWYSDRYLPSSGEQAKAMQTGKAAAKREIENIDQTMAKLSTYTPSKVGSNPINGSRILEAATAYFQKTVSTKSTMGTTKGTAETLPQTSGPDLEEYTAIAQELEAIANRVEQKLKALEESKAKAREKLLEFSKLYTAPSDNPEEPPHYKYWLSGVCATPHIVYVLEKTKPDDEDDMLSAEAEDWQWWKLGYDRGEWEPVSRTKVQEHEVLAAAKEQCDTALLVYASERALSFTPESLPSQLQNFVRADNLSFAAELDAAASPKPTSPAKRKADDEDDNDLGLKLYRSPTQGNPSETSQATNTVDPTLPTYASNASPPNSVRPMAEINKRKVASYDDVIPTSLQATEPTVDPSSMVLVDYEDGQEMQDRGGGMGLLQSGKHEEGYALGDYVPDISMEDREDEDVEEISHVEFTRTIDG